MHRFVIVCLLGAAAKPIVAKSSSEVAYLKGISCFFSKRMPQFTMGVSCKYEDNCMKTTAKRKGKESTCFDV